MSTNPQPASPQPTGQSPQEGMGGLAQMFAQLGGNR